MLRFGAKMARPNRQRTIAAGVGRGTFSDFNGQPLQKWDHRPMPGKSRSKSRGTGKNGTHCCQKAKQTTKQQTKETTIVEKNQRSGRYETTYLSFPDDICQKHMPSQNWSIP